MADKNKPITISDDGKPPTSKRIKSMQGYARSVDPETLELLEADAEDESDDGK